MLPPLELVICKPLVSIPVVVTVPALWLMVNTVGLPLPLLANIRMPAWPSVASVVMLPLLLTTAGEPLEPGVCST